MSFTEQQKQTLLELARRSIEFALNNQGQRLNVKATDYEEALQAVRATFVTLTTANGLRGCIGTLQPVLPIVEDVVYHAHAAAFSDPRFPPVQEPELADLHIHISVLSLPEPVSFSSEADLVQQLRPGIDGLILEDGFNKGTFLPSVWESLPEPVRFLQNLKRKAGLPPDYWSETIRIERYMAESIG